MNFDKKIIFNISRHEMKISTIAFTDNGMEIAGRLADSFEDCEFEISRCARGGLSQWTEFHRCDGNSCKGDCSICKN